MMQPNRVAKKEKIKKLEKGLFDMNKITTSFWYTIKSAKKLILNKGFMY